MQRRSFNIESLIGKMVAEEGVVIPGRTNVAPGTVLYRVLWKDFPPEIATWEDEDTIHDDFINAYEERLEVEGEGEGEGDSESEDEEEL